ncbi:MAG: Crp/Fnr family transcriptional regulator [Limisphaerales bacterium]
MSNLQMIRGTTTLPPDNASYKTTAPKEESMNNAALKSMVSAHPFVQGMRPEHLKVLLDCARAVKFEPDHVIFKEGEPANEFFLIEQGKIALEAHEPADGTALVQMLGADDVLGWSWLFPPYVWHLRAHVIEPTTALELNGARLLIHAEQDHDFGFELMKRVAKIVINRLQATRRELLAHRQEALWPA